MPPCHGWVALAVCLLGGSATAQKVTLTTAMGQQLPAELLRLESDGRMVVRANGRQQTIALDGLLSIHCAVPKRQGSVEAHLVGGERLHGDVRAGDRDGETFGLESPSLGRLAVPIDRLLVMMFRERAGDARIEDFQIPADARADEALFRRARKVGFSRLLGGIYRFRETTLLFEAGEGDDVRDAEAFRYDELAAITLRGGIEREKPPQAFLLTRSGDYVGVDIRKFADGEFTFAAEDADRDFVLGVEDIAALTIVADGRRFLSDLPIEVVEERAFFEDAGVLMPHRRDHSVSGGYLVSGGVAYGKGVGVHSRSVLQWKVPAGAESFHAVVGLDDEVRRLGLRSTARVVVKLDDQLLWQKEDLDAADGGINLGLLKVTPGATLTLEADFGKGFDLGDRVDWLGAVFLD